MWSGVGRVVVLFVVVYDRVFVGVVFGSGCRLFGIFVLFKGELSFLWVEVGD